MIRSSIRTKILAIAVGMIVLMVITAVLSLTLVTQVGHRLEQMTNSYIPAYGNLAAAISARWKGPWRFAAW
jgi:adenylate cyclase